MAEIKKRILFISQFYNPEQPDVRWHSLCRGLVEEGFSVQVLTGFPNYPGGKIYDGYKQSLYKKEVIDGVVIRRVPLYPSHGVSKIGRILNYLSFAFSAIILGSFVVKKAKFIISYHPPATVLFPTMWFKNLFGAKTIYDIQDMWPDTLKATGMINNESLLNNIGKFMNFFYKRLDKISVISNGFKNKLIEKGVSEDKIQIVYNWSINEIKELKRQEKKNETCVFLFAGNMGRAQSLETIIYGAKKLKENAENFKIQFLGDGISKPELVDLCKKLNLEDTVEFLAKVGPSEVNKFLQSADVLLVHLKKDPLFEITIPSKVQSYLQSGKAVLVGVDGEASQIVKDAKAGLAFNAQDVDDFVLKASEFIKLNPLKLQEFGDNGRNYYYNTMSQKQGVARFIKLINSFEK